MTAPFNPEFEVQFRKVLALNEEGKHAAAVGIVKGLAENCSDPRVFVACGMALKGLRHWAEAAVQFQHALNLKPHYCEGDTRLFLAEALLKSGRKKEAIAQWKVVAAMKPEYPSYESVPNEAKKWLAEYAG